MRGKIVKGIAGFYYVVCDRGLLSCKARGSFRNQKLKPMVGDDVEVEIIDEEAMEGSIEEVLERRNMLIRPAVANIDCAVVVLAAAKPAPQLYLLDKYLVSMYMQNIPVAILFNKNDIEPARRYSDIYSNARYRIFITSTVSGEGIEEFRDFLKGRITVLAGPSGVGKSSITNMICPQANMETNSISRKIERGRHTTRHSELFCIDKDTFILDTPGFTSISIDELPRTELKLCFPEIAGLEGGCRFNGCVHIAEPDCMIKQAVEEKRISEERYKSYVKLYNEISEKRRY